MVSAILALYFVGYGFLSKVVSPTYTSWECHVTGSIFQCINILSNY